jgi:hypothetical protein
MAHWNEKYRDLYDRTYRVLFDAGISEKAADKLAAQRTLAVALRSLSQPVAAVCNGQFHTQGCRTVLRRPRSRMLAQFVGHLVQNHHEREQERSASDTNDAARAAARAQLRLLKKIPQFQCPR